MGRYSFLLLVGSLLESNIVGSNLRPDVLSMYSVPQGSILRPLQFISYIAPVPDAILDYNLNCLFYVGDSKVNISPSNVQGGGEGVDDKTSAPDVFSSCSFTPRANFERSAVMVSFYV